MNKKQRNLFLVLLGTFICLGIMFLIAGILKILPKTIKQMQTGTAAASINAGLISKLKNGNPHLEEIFSPTNEKWRFLTVSEYDKTIMVLDNTVYGGLDAGRERPLLDVWGNRLIIGYRNLPNGSYESVVVSKGPDGICATGDDLVYDSVYGGGPSIRSSILTILKENQKQ